MFHDRRRSRLEAEFTSHPGQQFDVSTPIGTEPEVLSDVHLSNRQALNEDIADEALGRHSRHPMGERHQKAGFDAGSSDQLKTLIEGRHETWRVGRP